MESRRTGAVVAIGALVVAVVLFIVLSGDDSSNDSSTSTTTSASQTSGGNDSGDNAGSDNSSGDTGGAADEPVITIKDGAAVGGVQDLTFDKGDDIRFEVKSDAAYEIHFHGYDVAQDVPAGGVTKFDVPGDADGIYEVEIEDTATQIAEITVNP